MAGTYGGGQQSDGLLRELLTLFDALDGRQGHIHRATLIGLFAIDHSPLGLMAG